MVFPGVSNRVFGVDFCVKLHKACFWRGKIALEWLGNLLLPPHKLLNEPNSSFVELPFPAGYYKNSPFRPIEFGIRDGSLKES